MSKKSDFVEIEIIDDEEDEFEYIIPNKKPTVTSNTTSSSSDYVLVETVKKVRKPRIINILKTYYNEDPNIYEIGVDEAGRGPLFGRVYAGAVIYLKKTAYLIIV